MEFGGVKDEADVNNWRGRPHDFCIGKGTPVRMADGSYKPIEDIRVGDYVTTLEGAHQVMRVAPVQNKPAVLARAYVGNTLVATQVQGESHSVLTKTGWVSHCKMAEWTSTCLPYDAIAHGYGDTLVGLYQCQLAISRQLLSGSHSGQLPSEATLPIRRGPLDWWGVSPAVSGGDESVPGICSEEYCGLRQETLRHSLSSDHQGHWQPSLHLDMPAERQRVGERATCDVPFEALSEDLTAHCWFHTHLYGERPRQFLRGVLVCPQPQADAERPIPTDFGDDVLGRTPRYTHRIGEYAHPYTMESRQTLDEFLSCDVSFEPIGNQNLYDITIDKVSHYITQFCGFVNMNCGFDELCEFSLKQFLTLTAWNRTTLKGQRCRIVAAFNPPNTSEGQWVIEYFAPWIDPKYPGKRALPGELRWFAVLDGKDVERPDSEPFEHEGRKVIPKSRTFIPAKLTDNPYLADTNYASTLMALDEVQRKQLLDGDFTTLMHDDAEQVIPSVWVDLAIERGKGTRPDVKILSIGIDVSRGGVDASVFAKRYANWIDPLIVFPGSEITSGQAIVSRLINIFEEGAVINIDANSWGSSAYDQLCQLDYNVIGTIAQEGCEDRDKSGKYGFVNVRARDWWHLREMLDPNSGENVCLPDDPEMRADLIAPRYYYRGGKIGVEGKDEIKKRRGKSTDYGDAVVLAMAECSAMPNFRTLG